MRGIEMGKPIEILLVEDNPGDARLAVEAMKEGKVRNHMEVVEDGVEAMNYLRGEGEYAGKPRPDLVLLDLNMPRMDGREVLKAMKTDPELCSIPVVILTVSKDEQDILSSYEHHANCYVTKPLDFDQFIHVVKSIENFWFTLVQLPMK